MPSTGLAYERSHACPAGLQAVIDSFGLALSHGLLMLAAIRLLSRPDLDRDGAGSGDARGWAAVRRRKPDSDADA